MIIARDVKIVPRAARVAYNIFSTIEQKTRKKQG
jgi:hypothetical protein